MDGVRWGQLLLQTPQGVCAKTVQRYFKLARDTGRVRDTRSSNRPATSTGTVMTLGCNLVTLVTLSQPSEGEGLLPFYKRGN